MLIYEIYLISIGYNTAHCTKNLILTEDKNLLIKFTRGLKNDKLLIIFKEYERIK